MSENKLFREPIEEVRHLIGEISDLKETLRDLSKRIIQIERHVKRAFNIPSPMKTENQITEKFCSEKATIDADQALKLFDELAEIWNIDKSRSVEERLLLMPIPDLKIMAHELGLSFKSKPSKKSLCSGIMGRINERIMLSTNVNITQPKSKVMNDTDKAQSIEAISKEKDYGSNPS